MTSDNQFERQKLCYAQNCEMFRSLNQIMWQVPLIATTLTGGLWFGVSVFHEGNLGKAALLFLASIANFGLVIVLRRVRFIMGEYLKAIKEFYPAGFVPAVGKNWYEKSHVVINAFTVIMIVAGTFSMLGFTHFFGLSARG